MEIELLICGGRVGQGGVVRVTMVIIQSRGRTLPHVTTHHQPEVTGAGAGVYVSYPHSVSNNQWLLVSIQYPNRI